MVKQRRTVLVTLKGSAGKRQHRLPAASRVRGLRQWLIDGVSQLVVLKHKDVILSDKDPLPGTDRKKAFTLEYSTFGDDDNAVLLDFWIAKMVSH